MLHVSLLGEQAITNDRAGSFRLRSARAVVLVAFLATHAGSPQPRARIAGLFWPESTDAQALTNLRRELHHLRQVLSDEPALVVTPRDLCWCDTKTCRVDVRIFDIERKAALAAAAADDSNGVLVHAARAIAEYRGDLLPGVYEDWLLEARAEIERQCVDLCDLLCETRACSGDLTGAVEAARRRIQLQPLEEVGYRTLMQLQADLGDRAGAVSTYHHCASVLERELGVVPDATTRKAFERLMAHASPAAGSRETIEPRAGRPGRPERSSSAVLPNSACSRTGGGPPQRAAVVSCWSAGARVSARPAWWPRSRRWPGCRVPWSRAAQCFGTSGRLALAPVADWLRHDAVQSAAATIDPAWRAEVNRLIPAEGHAGRESRPQAMADAWQRHRFYEGLARALIAVDRPMLVVLDNMQWCDQETLAFITFCLGLAGGTPLLVAGTLRDDNLGEDPELQEWIVRMRATGLLTELILGPLDAAGTAHLARAISRQPLQAADADLLYATTGGFPLYVIEAVRGTGDPGGTSLPPGDLQAVLRKRFEQTTAAAREVAGLAAAVGTNFTLGLLAEASDLEADIVVQAVDELWRRRIMQEFGDGYDFSHDMLREAAYAQVSPPKRWLLHRRVAQGLELIHADDTDAVAAQLAEQYAKGGQGERAVAYYRRAADIAAARFGHAEAIRLHRQALSIIGKMPAGRGRDSRELTVLEALAAPLNARYGYASPDLQRTLERSVALAESLGRKGSTAAGMISLFGSRFVQGRGADSYQLATRALSLVGPDSELIGQAHFAVGGSALSLGRPAEGLRHLELAAELAGPAVSLSIGTRADVHSKAWSAHAHWLLGQDGECAVRLPGHHQPGPGDRRPVQPGRGPGLCLHHLPDARRPARAEADRRRAARTMRPV